MLLNFNVPIYRFFGKESHADSMIKEGRVFFNTIKAFNTIDHPDYRDDDEGGHKFKIPTPMTPIGIPSSEVQVVASFGIRKRRIPNAWAFCGTCSSISKARKEYAVRIDHPMLFLQQLDYSIKKKFHGELPIFFGPVSYYHEEIDNMNAQEQPIYFSKQDKYKEDLEFRIVVIPPPNMQEALLPITLEIPEPQKVFSKPLFF